MHPSRTEQTSGVVFQAKRQDTELVTTDDALQNRSGQIILRTVNLTQWQGARE